MTLGLGCPEACGSLPGPGIKPTSPALAGGFPTTEPPGKPHMVSNWLFHVIFSTDIQEPQQSVSRTTQLHLHEYTTPSAIEPPAFIFKALVGS